MHGVNEDSCQSVFHLVTGEAVTDPCVMPRTEYAIDVRGPVLSCHHGDLPDVRCDVRAGTAAAGPSGPVAELSCESNRQSNAIKDNFLCTTGLFAEIDCPESDSGLLDHAVSANIRDSAVKSAGRHARRWTHGWILR